MSYMSELYIRLEEASKEAFAMGEDDSITGLRSTLPVTGRLKLRGHVFTDAEYDVHEGKTGISIWTYLHWMYGIGREGIEAVC